jgi:hypothetical protein
MNNAFDMTTKGRHANRSNVDSTRHWISNSAHISATDRDRLEAAGGLMARCCLFS